jgi:hypothetical protein
LVTECAKVTPTALEIELYLDLAASETMQSYSIRYTLDQTAENEDQRLETIHNVVEHDRFLERLRSCSTYEGSFIFTPSAPYEHGTPRTQSMNNGSGRERTKITDEAHAPAQERRRDLGVRIEESQRQRGEKLSRPARGHDSHSAPLTRRDRRAELRVGDPDPYR